MSHTLLYTKTAVSDIRKLDKIVKKKIKNKIEHYSTNPLSFAKKLTNSTIGQYRWRIGNHRVVFDMHGNNIVILRVGHRKEIYK